MFVSKYLHKDKDVNGSRMPFKQNVIISPQSVDLVIPSQMSIPMYVPWFLEMVVNGIQAPPVVETLWEPPNCVLP